MSITVNSLTADGIQAQEFTEMSICGPEKDVYISHDKLRITTLSVNDDMAVIEVCAQLKNIIGHGLEAECLIEIKKMGRKLHRIRKE